MHLQRLSEEEKGHKKTSDTLQVLQESMKLLLSSCKCSALGCTRFITLNKYLDCPLYIDTEVGEEGRNVMFKH